MKHSTRGRARLLFEMMRSDSPLDGGWRNEDVEEALDLCLACKGCLHECSRYRAWSVGAGSCGQCHRPCPIRSATG